MHAVAFSTSSGVLGHQWLSRLAVCPQDEGRRPRPSQQRWNIAFLSASDHIHWLKPCTRPNLATLARLLVFPGAHSGPSLNPFPLAGT